MQTLTTDQADVLAELATELPFGADFATEFATGMDRRSETIEHRLRLDMLYREHRADVIRALRARLDNEEDVADLAQEAYLRVMRYRHCGAQSLKFLLLRIALNLAVSHHRSARVRCDVPLDNVEFHAGETAIELRLIEEERHAQLRAAMWSLPPRCRQVLMLSCYDGLPQREIARRCGISRRMVERHLERARALLRKRVGES